MTRSEGFRTADIDVSLLGDPKFRRLGRLLPKSAALSEAIVLYLSTVLESWAAGERVCADDAAPLWMRNHSERAASLQEAGLLDDDRMLPEHSWDSWFGPAAARREARRASGRNGGSVKRNGSDAKATLKQSSSDAKATLKQSHYTPASVALPVPIRSVPIRSVHSARDDIDPFLDGLPHVDDDTLNLGEQLTHKAFRLAGDKQQTELDRLLEAHGSEAVQRALRLAAGEAPNNPPTWVQVIYGARNLLEPISRPAPETPREAAARAEAEAERKRRERSFAATQRRIHELETPPAVDPEKAAAAMAAAREAIR